MEHFFQDKTAIFSKKVPPDILVEWRILPVSRSLILQPDSHGGKLYLPEAQDNKPTPPDYYFTLKSHKNFYHPYYHMMMECSY